MKTICNGAKRQLSNCMLQDMDDALSPTLTMNNNFLANVNTSTYDSLQRPFRVDNKRGRWSSPVDFYFACTSHAFGSVIFSELPVYAVLFGGVFFLPAYLMAIFLYAIPVFAIQSFLGQFSTSGAISAFRVCPLFKGIGYSILLLNLSLLSFYGVLAAVPLIYAANSLHTVIPWMSCDNAWNSPNCSTHNVYDEEDELQYPHATVEFFRAIIASTNDAGSNFTLSWPILCGVIGVWLLTLGILLKKVSFIGKVFRCSCIVMLTVFVANFVHLLFHANISWSIILSYFEPTIAINWNTLFASMRAAIFMSTWLLGAGYGGILTMASYNTFRRNTESLTYWISITHVILAIMAMICGRIALDHFEDHVGMLHYHVEEHHFMQFIYLCFAYLFGSFNTLPNLWSFLFFSMLFIAELSAMIVQMMSVLTAIFDEYEKLRTKKTRITIGIVAAMMVLSLYFCTRHGFRHLHVLPTVSILTHVTISIIILLMTTWIYGRERFQCDLQFMLGKTISNFKIFLLRFVTPAFLAICVLQVLFFLEQDEPPSLLLIFSQSMVYIVAPAYMIYKYCQTTGPFANRIRQCFAPHDWHPVDVDNRRFYEEVFGISEMLVLNDEQHEINTDFDDRAANIIVNST